MPSQPIPKCPACGSEVLEPGWLPFPGLGVFQPQRKGYSIGDPPIALACLDCGHISMWLHPVDLSGMRKARDAGRLKPR